MTDEEYYEIAGHPDMELPINDLGIEEPDFLNKVDMGYVGLTKPDVVRIIEPDTTPTRFEDSDNDAANPLEADWNDIDE